MQGLPPRVPLTLAQPLPAVSYPCLRAGVSAPDHPSPAHAIQPVSALTSVPESGGKMAHDGEAARAPILVGGALAPPAAAAVDFDAHVVALPH
jgi:hypothetical protein